MRRAEIAFLQFLKRANRVVMDFPRLQFCHKTPD